MAEHVKKVGISVLAPVFSELLEEGKTVKFTVVGNSMYPMLRSGVDSVVLEKKEKLKKYDIPFYKRENGEYILHRIVKEKDGAFFCAGDNELELEYPVHKSQIIGVVSGFYRKDRYISAKNFFYICYSFFWVNFKYLRFIFFGLNKIRRRIKK